MKTIWKYPLCTTDSQPVVMPHGAEILTVQEMGGVICLWAIVDPSQPQSPRMIDIYGTGHPFGECMNSEYIGTVQMEYGRLVWHVFERKP